VIPFGPGGATKGDVMEPPRLNIKAQKREERRRLRNEGKPFFKLSFLPDIMQSRGNQGKALAA